MRYRSSWSADSAASGSRTKNASRISFNDGTVLRRKRGENYIYEGLVLRFMKSDWQYHDATNVVGYPRTVDVAIDIPADLKHFDEHYFKGDRIVIDAGMALNLLKSAGDPCRTLWVFRYYDLDDRRFETYGKALVRLISFLRDLASFKSRDAAKPKVNILAHSMGGLLVREAIQVTYPELKQRASDHINKVVTLGTPHQGISFQFLQDWLKVDAEQELEHFNPAFQRDEQKKNRKESTRTRRTRRPSSTSRIIFRSIGLLTVVGHELPHVFRRRLLLDESAVCGHR